MLCIYFSSSLKADADPSFSCSRACVSLSLTVVRFRNYYQLSIDYAKFCGVFWCTSYVCVLQALSDGLSISNYFSRAYCGTYRVSLLRISPRANDTHANIRGSSQYWYCSRNSRNCDPIGSRPNVTSFLVEHTWHRCAEFYIF